MSKEAKTLKWSDEIKRERETWEREGADGGAGRARGTLCMCACVWYTMVVIIVAIECTEGLAV